MPPWHPARGAAAPLDPPVRLKRGSAYLLKEESYDNQTHGEDTSHKGHYLCKLSIHQPKGLFGYERYKKDKGKSFSEKISRVQSIPGALIRAKMQ